MREKYSPRGSSMLTKFGPRKSLFPDLPQSARRSLSPRSSRPGQGAARTKAGRQEGAEGTVQTNTETGRRERDQEEAKQGRQPGQGGTESRLKTILLDGDTTDESRTEQQPNREQRDAGEKKEQRKEASHMAGAKGCTKQPQGARERSLRTTRDLVKGHLEEKAQERKTQSPGREWPGTP